MISKPVVTKRRIGGEDVVMAKVNKVDWAILMASVESMRDMMQEVKSPNGNTLALILILDELIKIDANAPTPDGW